MDVKKIILFTVVLMIAVSSLSMVSAGWFDNNIEASTFKFEMPEGYSGDSLGDGVLLTHEKDGTNLIQVNELDKANFTSFMNGEPVSFVETSVNGESADSSNQVVKEVKEDNYRIVAQKNDLMGMAFTNAAIEKDGSYYSVFISHKYDTSLIDKDIQIVKDIFDSLEKT